MLDEAIAKRCENVTGQSPAAWLQKVMPLNVVVESGRKGDKIEAVKVAGEQAPLLTDEQKQLFDDVRTQLAIRYLAEADHKQSGKVDAKTKEADVKLLNRSDTVANFHLANGSYIGNIAIQQGKDEWRDAGGVMVNYVYGPHRLTNLDEYDKKGTVHMDGALLDQHPEIKLPEHVRAIKAHVGMKNEHLQPFELSV